MQDVTDYFNTPSTGLVFEESIKEAYVFNQGLQSGAAKFAFSEGLPVIEELRNRIATFTASDPEEVAFIPNTTYGLNVIIPALKRKSVLFYNLEYYGLTMSWELHGYTTHLITDEDGFYISTDKIKSELISKKIEVLVMSSVQWQTGFAIDFNDLGRFCKEHGIIFILDIAQSFGSSPFSFENTVCDITICPSYKWLNAGFGMGILWMKKDFFKKHPPTITGYGAFGPSFNPEKYAPNIRCYEPGHPNFACIIMMNEAIKKKQKIGMDKIYEHNTSMTNSFLSECQANGLEVVGTYTRKIPSSIVVVKNSDRIVANIEKYSIDCTPRGAGFRFGFHFHNSQDAVRQLAAQLGE